MAYIGNSPEVNAFTIALDKFSGTGAQLQYTLSRHIDNAKDIEVVVNGVQQTPDSAYTVTNGVINFDEAPSLGTDNIIVTYLAPIVVTFNQVSQSQILANAVGTTQIANNAVTSDKIAPGTVIAADIAERSITGNLIANNAISGNNIVAGTITGNLIANNAISGNNIVSPPDIFDDAFLFGGM
jgi:hypothetical protein